MTRQFVCETRPAIAARTPTTFGKPVVRGLIAGSILFVLICAGVWALSINVDWKIDSENNAIFHFCQWLYDTETSIAIRESLYFFPVIEGIHLLAIGLSVGMLCWFDLRLLGLAFRDQPVSKVWRQVMPAAFIGFALMFISGGLLFWAEAMTAYQSVHFWIKLLLLALAGVNAFIFERTGHADMKEWDMAAVPPLRARMAGLISLVLWAAIIITGRTMAYTF
jgi:hypothetical protein